MEFNPPKLSELAMEILSDMDLEELAMPPDVSLIRAQPKEDVAEALIAMEEATTALGEVAALFKYSAEYLKHHTTAA